MINQTKNSASETLTKEFFLTTLEQMFKAERMHNDSKFSNLETKMTGMETKMSGMETKMTGVDGRINSLEQVQKEQTQIILDAVDYKLKRNQEETLAAFESLIQDNVKTFGDDHHTTKSNVTVLQHKVAALERGMISAVL